MGSAGKNGDGSNGGGGGGYSPSDYGGGGTGATAGKSGIVIIEYYTSVAEVIG